MGQVPRPTFGQLRAVKLACSAGGDPAAGAVTELRATFSCLREAHPAWDKSHAPRSGSYEP